MSRYLLGCTGWGYEDWRGGFYPPGTPAGDFLRRYSRVFRITEVDSAYYQAPSREQVARWAEATPDEFLFTVKFPGDVTHKAALRGVEGQVDSFLASLAPLKVRGKLGPLLLQLPASFRRDKDAGALEAFLQELPADVDVAVELRHRSWWVPETYKLLESRGAALVWSVTEYGRTPPVVTADWLYLRLIGDRALTKFDRVQRDHTDEMRHWAARLQDEGAGAMRVYAFANNHFIGFAPGAVIRFAELLDVPKPDLSAAMRPLGQSSLGDLFR